MLVILFPIPVHPRNVIRGITELEKSIGPTPCILQQRIGLATEIVTFLLGKCFFLKGYIRFLNAKPSRNEFFHITHNRPPLRQRRN